MKYLDASAILRVLFHEPGVSVTLDDAEPLVSSTLVEVQTFRAVDRLRLLGTLGDAHTALKRAELGNLLSRLDLASIDGEVTRRARSPFAVNVRALDAIHVATAEILAEEAGESLEFWAHDQRQATAALSRGLTVLGV